MKLRGEYGGGARRATGVWPRDGYWAGFAFEPESKLGWAVRLKANWSITKPGLR